MPQYVYKEIFVKPVEEQRSSHGMQKKSGQEIPGGNSWWNGWNPGPGFTADITARSYPPWYLRDFNKPFTRGQCKSLGVMQTFKILSKEILTLEGMSPINDSNILKYPLKQY